MHSARYICYLCQITSHKSECFIIRAPQQLHIGYYLNIISIRYSRYETNTMLYNPHKRTLELSYFDKHLF